MVHRISAGLGVLRLHKDVEKTLALRCGLVSAEATALSRLIHCLTNRVSVVPPAIRVVTSDRGKPDGEFDFNQNRFSFARG